MPSEGRLARFVLLPELNLISVQKVAPGYTRYVVEKRSPGEVCTRCANFSSSVYDRRTVVVKDAPIRGVQVDLKIIKRRFYCKTCRKPFTEPVQGVFKGRRTTERFRRSLLWAYENFSDLEKVRKAYSCSTWMVYRAVYDHLKLKLKERLNYPWPSTIGIDEHFISRSKGYREFATVIVDYNNKRPRELVLGKSAGVLRAQLDYIPGRENVRNVVLDLSDTYKSFVKDFFPNARIIADKFHVLRLLVPHINRRRKQITGDQRSNPVRKLLLRAGHTLKYYERGALRDWLKNHPGLEELYDYKEALNRFYRIRGKKQAARILTRITDQMAESQLPEIKSLRRTLMKWRNEILNYFETRITNARTEGFNNVAKLIQKRSYGVKSFELYRGSSRISGYRN